MRALTPTERLLGIGLGACVILVATFVLFRWVAGRIQAERAELAELTTRRAEFRSLLDERPYWEARGAWIAEHPLDPYTGRDADSRFAESAQKSIAAGGLEIESQQLQEPERDGELMKTTLDLVIRGDLEALVRWLWTTQRPGSYVRVESFTLKRADEGTKMRLQVKLRKVFRASPVATSE